MKNLIYISDSYALGGTELYVFRLFEMSKTEFSLYTLVLNDTNISNECSDKLQEYHVKIGNICENRKGYIIKNIDLESVLKADDTIIFATSLRCFIATSYIRNKYKQYYIKNFLYVLHPEAVLPFSYDSFKRKYNNRLLRMLIELMRKIYIIPYKKSIFKMIDSKQIVFMDQQTYENTKKIYNDNDTHDYEIIRIGTNVLDWREDFRIYYEKNCVITISRIDFPFKGYLKGLIDDFSLINKKYKDSKLVIIGDGDSRSELESMINNLGSNVREKITWIKSVRYDKLEEYLKRAMVFIGMGTSILDAAQYGIPSILASAYQIDNYAASFFHDKPDRVGISVWEEGGKKYHFYDLIKFIFELDTKTYNNLCTLTYDNYKNNYDINIIYNNLFKRNYECVDDYKQLKRIIDIKLLYRVLKSRRAMKYVKENVKH